ncbi:MAG: ATP-dependent metallopeptidase FtsH/Yme1/Tma family protein, partial [Candidatus Methylomirabilales bacterium]
MSPFFKNLALWLVIGLIMVLIFNIFQQGQPLEKEFIFSDFMQKVDRGEVAEVTLKGSDIKGTLSDGTKFRTYSPDDRELVPNLRKKGVRITARPVEQNPWYQIVLGWLPMLVFIGIWIFFMRQMQGGGAKALSFGKSRARLLTEKQNKVTFADVAGVEEATEELQEIIEFLKDPQKFQKLGGRIPKGV